MAERGHKDRAELAEEYASLAREAEKGGNHRRAADLYRAALFILYNYEASGDAHASSYRVQNSNTGAGSPPEL